VKRNRFIWWLWAGIAALLLACEPGPKASSPRTVVQKRDTAFTCYLDSIPTDIAIPANHNGKTLLLLPGWNYPRTGWCDSTEICRKALAAGYALVAPEMGKSIYATRYYPETRQDWRRYPTLAWLMDTLTPHLQHTYGLLQQGQPNYVLGRSGMYLSPRIILRRGGAIGRLRPA